jgi:hypothetical protein
MIRAGGGSLGGTRAQIAAIGENTLDDGPPLGG